MHRTIEIGKQINFIWSSDESFEMISDELNCVVWIGKMQLLFPSSTKLVDRLSATRCTPPPVKLIKNVNIWEADAARALPAIKPSLLIDS